MSSFLCMYCQNLQIGYPKVTHTVDCTIYGCEAVRGYICDECLRQNGGLTQDQKRNWLFAVGQHSEEFHKSIDVV